MSASIDFSKLNGVNRLLLRAWLKPVQGDRFQPTGFPDIGAAVYEAADGTKKLLVESAQSVANRLEATIIGSNNELIPEFKGLSYVRAELSGNGNTNTLIEAHRLNSPFIIDGFSNIFAQETGYDRMGAQIDWQKIARALYKYDVNSLLHGIFFSNLKKGGSLLRFSRAVSGFIEASMVKEVVSGGTKIDHVDATGKTHVDAKGNEYVELKDVYGNVPFHRTEYVAKEIIAYFNIDLDLLRSYQLGDDAFRLLVSLAIYKIDKFLETGLRLRTACDLQMDRLVVDKPDGFELPDSNTAKEMVQEYIEKTKAMFADQAPEGVQIQDGVTTIQVKTKKDSSKKNM